MASPPDPDAPPPRLRPRRSLALFLGRDAALEPGQLRTLMLVSLGIFFEQYDVGLVNAALPQIAHGLVISTGDTGFYLGAIRAGGFGTLLLVPFADRIGRRRVFLGSLIGMSVGTLATGFSQTPLQFALFQAFTRAFLLTGMALAVVILVEEFPAEYRGGALGLLSLLGAAGYGLSAGLYAAVEVLPWGWRTLYLFGVAPLLVLPFLRRRLAETARFDRHRQATHPEEGWNWLRPIAELVRTHPRRAGAVGLAGLVVSMAAIPVFQYLSYFVQTRHGWAPGQYTLLILVGGLLGTAGNLVGGRGSDRYGRRGVGFACMAGLPVFAMLLFLGPETLLVFAFALFVLCVSGADVVLNALSAELFPTSHRGTSSGWMMVVRTTGYTLGLLLVGFGTESVDDLTRMVAGLSSVSVLGGLGLLLLPETTRRELESLS